MAWGSSAPLFGLVRIQSVSPIHVGAYRCQLSTSSCCGQGLVVSYKHHLAVVKGWWSAMNTFFERTLAQRFREQCTTITFTFAKASSALFPKFAQGFSNRNFVDWRWPCSPPTSAWAPFCSESSCHTCTHPLSPHPLPVSYRLLHASKPSKGQSQVEVVSQSVAPKRTAKKLSSEKGEVTIRSALCAGELKPTQSSG